LDQLCPIGPARRRPPRVYQNLPAPTYSQFIEHKEASAEVLEGLSKRSAAVIIVGLGGNGKTSLARGIADYCLKSEHGQALFDAARTLDYPGFTQFEHDEKRREVEQLLRRQRVLSRIEAQASTVEVARIRWINWYANPATRVGFCWNDLEGLKLLDLDGASGSSREPRRSVRPRPGGAS
jgi:hypothetical protein